MGAVLLATTTAGRAQCCCATHLLIADIDGSLASAEPALAKYPPHCSRGLVELTPVGQPAAWFIHEIVRDILTDEEVRGRRLSAGSGISVVLPDFQPDSCHTTIAEGCLQSLLDLGQKTPSPGPRTRQHPLASYAAEHSWRRMQESSDLCSQTLLHLALELLTDETNCLPWTQLDNIDKT